MFWEGFRGGFGGFGNSKGIQSGIMEFWEGSGRNLGILGDFGGLLVF